MGAEHGDGSGPDGDQVQFGSDRAPRWGLSRWALADRRGVRRLAAVAVAVVAVGVGAGIAVTGSGRVPARSPAFGSSAASGSSAVFGPGSVTVKRLGHPIAGGSPGWELLGVSGGWEPGADWGTLIRVQPAAGVVTLTKIPALDSNGPVTILATGGETFIRPLDYVPGYLVPDGRPARGLPAAMGDGDVAFPGPRPGELWVGGTRGAAHVLRLMTTAGAPVGVRADATADARVGAATGAVIRLPANGDLGVPDGSGYVLLQEGGAVYDARPGGERRVAAGTLVAAGRSAWLISTCPDAVRCVNTVIDPATGTRRVLPGRTNLFGGPDPFWPPGQISADGGAAAFLRYGRGQNGFVHLVNLRTGAERKIPAGRLSPDAGFGLVWSPDGRWLFTLMGGGTIEAIDVRSGHIRGLGVALPPVSYLAAGVSG